MTRLFYLCIIGLAMVACSEKGDGSGEPFTPQTYEVCGKVEKGPFISGSTISIQPMNAKLQVLGGIYNTTITNDMGGFEFGSKELPSPYAELMATGYFFNEVKGALSSGTLTLRALVDLTDQMTVNVNILTHLKYARIKRLVASGVTFGEASQQAQQELFAAFGLSEYANREVASFSMMSGSNEAAALIAISSLLLMDRSEAAFTEYLSKLSETFGRNGCFSDDQLVQIAKDKQLLAKDLSAIQEHIIARYNELGVAVTVKDLAPFIDWDNDGKAGNELLKDGESIRLHQTTFAVPAEGGNYTVQIESPIQLYLESQVDTDPIPSQGVTSEEYFSEGLYEGYDDYALNKGVCYSASLNSSELTIVVASSKFYRTMQSTVPLYDYIGNEVASVELTQAGRSYGDAEGEVPRLGERASMLMAGIAGSVANAIRNYNLIEQYYTYNKQLNLVQSYVGASAGALNQAWECFYKANRDLLTLQQADAERLGVYADYCAVLQALYYCNMVYGWGGVPYISRYEQYDEISAQAGLGRETPQRIFSDLKTKLQVAIDHLEEKRNQSLNTPSDFFLVSKDVARVLLANIYMYEGAYSDARPLLERVIDNNYYTLDSSTNFRPGIDTSGIDVSASTEVIYVLQSDTGGRGITLVYPGVMPCITLSDVMLSLAECCCKMNEPEQVASYINPILSAKNIELTEVEPLLQIRELREFLLIHSGTYFAFLKRTGLAESYCDIEPYQLLFPIPENEMRANSWIEQNQGW